MLRRFRRSLRVSGRRIRRARRVWVRQSVDANLPDAVTSRVPGWASNARGRVVLSVLAVVVLLGWLLLMLLITL
ncbi:hypothetical protein GCM10009670_12280 [Citricoccus alkalitolerans]